MTVTELGMLAKYWQPGHVKTRLAAEVGVEAAAAVYDAGLRLLVQRFGDIADRRTIAYWPSAHEVDFRRLATVRWRLLPQVQGHLGQRMDSYFRDAFARGSHRVALIGSDSPTLPTAYIFRAFDELRRCAVVLGPSHDGGYYLVAARPDMPAMFDGIPWSTSNVWTRTCEVLQRFGTSWCELPEWYDVDELADLRRLERELAQQPDDNCASRQRLMAAVTAALVRS